MSAPKTTEPPATMTQVNAAIRDALIGTGLEAQPWNTTESYPSGRIVCHGAQLWYCAIPSGQFTTPGQDEPTPASMSWGRVSVPIFDQLYDLASS